MKLSRARGIYSSPEKWETIRRRARRLRMPISRLVVRCCLRAAEGVQPPEPPGHPLALGEDAQRRLFDDVRVADRSARIAVRGPDGGEAVLAVHEVVGFLLSTEGDAGGMRKPRAKDAGPDVHDLGHRRGVGGDRGGRGAGGQADLRLGGGVRADGGPPAPAVPPAGAGREAAAIHLPVDGRARAEPVRGCRLRPPGWPTICAPCWRRGSGRWPGRGAATRPPRGFARRSATGARKS